MREKEDKMKNKVDELRKSLFRANTPNELQSVFRNYKQVSELIGENFGEGNDYIEADIEAAMRSKTGKKSKYYREAYNALLQSINEIPI